MSGYEMSEPTRVDSVTTYGHWATVAGYLLAFLSFISCLQSLWLLQSKNVKINNFFRMNDETVSRSDNGRGIDGYCPADAKTLIQQDRMRDDELSRQNATPLLETMTNV